MNQEGRNIEDIDLQEDYEMVPLEPMMYGNSPMNMMSNMELNQNMGDSMGFMQDMNPNTRMNSMGMSQDERMNPWMGMSQFDEDMFMNGFNPMEGMDSDIAEYDGFRELDKSRQEESLQEQYSRPSLPIPPRPQQNVAEDIVRRIERYNPAIVSRMTRCGIPYVEAKDIIRRIVKVTLMYRDE